MQCNLLTDSQKQHCDDQSAHNLKKKSCVITIKCNHKCYKLDVTDCGKETLSLISSSLSIPLAQLKLVGGGKVLNEESITETVFDKKIKKFMVS